MRPIFTDEVAWSVGGSVQSRGPITCCRGCGFWWAQGTIRRGLRSPKLNGQFGGEMGGRL